MNSAHSFAHTARTAPPRRHLVLVESPAGPATPPRSAAVGALLAGLASGFVMAAMAAIAGGGNPGPAVAMAGCCALGMGVALVAARRATVRRRRALAATRRPTAPRPATAHVSPRLGDRRAA